MRYLAFVFYVTVLVIMASALGCGTDNPICTVSFCIVDREDVTGEVIELDNAKVLALIDSLAVETPEAVDTGTLPTGVTPIDLETIVADVASGSTTYAKAWVSLEGLVTTDLTDGGRSLLLETGNDSVNFRVSSFVKVSQLARWTKGNRYSFILLITDFQTRDTGITTIFSRVDDPDNIAKGKSVLTPTSNAVLAASINVLLESFRAGESYYIGKRVGFLDTVKIRQDDQTSVSSGNVYDRLVVYSENVGLFTTGRDSFSVYQTMNLFEGDIDPKFSEGSLQNFEVTIHYLSGEDFFNPDKVSIVGYFEDKSFLP